MYDSKFNEIRSPLKAFAHLPDRLFPDRMVEACKVEVRERKMKRENKICGLDDIFYLRKRGIVQLLLPLANHFPACESQFFKVICPVKRIVNKCKGREADFHGGLIAFKI